jgi:hypothetical protein|nr:hypothetical protein [uncultured Lachnoclostridium sp.]
MKINKILSATLALAVLVSVGAGVITVKAAPPKTSVVYKVTPVENYKDTMGKYLELTETGEILSFGEHQDYLSLECDEEFETHGVMVEEVDLDNINVNKSKTLSQGVYLVREIKPGKYKITGNGTAIMLSGVSKDRNMDFIQDTQVIVSEGETEYVTVKKSQFALYLIGDVKATRVK